MTPADELRTAANKLRALATAASTDQKGRPTTHWAVRYRPGVTPGAPEQRDRPCALVATDDTGHPARLLLHGGSSGPHGRGSRPAVEPQHGEYIAALDPTLGLTLADLLDDQADGDDEGVINPWALAVARAVNGQEQP